MTVPHVRRELVDVERANSTVASSTPLSEGSRPQTQESMVIEPDCKGAADSAGQAERRGEVVVGKSPACIARVTHDVVSWEVSSMGNQLPSTQEAETICRACLEQEVSTQDVSTRSISAMSAGHGRRVAWGHATAPASANAGAPPSEVEGGWRAGGMALAFLDGFLRPTMLAGADEAATRSGFLGPYGASTPRPLPLPPRPLEAPARTDKQGVAKPASDGPRPRSFDAFAMCMHKQDTRKGTLT